MNGRAGDWSAHQLAEFLALVASLPDADTARARGVERVAEILEAEVAALVTDTAVLASVGFASGAVPVADLVELACHPRSCRTTDVPWNGTSCVAYAGLDDSEGARLLVVRAGGEGCSPAELNLLRTMARALAQTLRMLGLLDAERAARASLTERQHLLERLSRIQRSISHRLPLGETLDAITAGAAELIGDEIVGLRLTRADDPARYELASHHGLSPEMLERMRTGPVGQGAGGRAIVEDRLVVVEDYQHAENMIPLLVEDRLTAAMAAPVHENGRVIGSLVVASHRPGRRYSPSEREVLLAFAEHASIALTDSKNYGSMLEAHRAKDAFLAMVTHELKTPLTVIMSALQTLRARGVSLPDDLREELFATAITRGRSLESLIEHLLRGARAEPAGASQTVDLGLLVTSTVSGYAHQHRVHVDPLPAVPVEVDLAAFRDTLTILLDVVSGESGEVVVSAEASCYGTSVRAARRGGPAVAETRGTDMTLYVASRLAESMGGSVEAGADAYVLRLPAPTALVVA